MTTKSKPQIRRHYAPVLDGAPFLEDIHDNEPDEGEKEVVLIWGKDYDALVKELEELRALREKQVETIRVFVEKFRKSTTEDHD